MRSPDESIDHGNFKYFFQVIVFAQKVAVR